MLKIEKKFLLILLTANLISCSSPVINNNLPKTNEVEIKTEKIVSSEVKPDQLSFNGKYYNIGDDVPDNLIADYIFPEFKVGRKLIYKFTKTVSENTIAKRILDVQNGELTIEILNIQDNKITVDISQKDDFSGEIGRSVKSITLGDSKLNTIIKFVNLYSNGLDDQFDIDSTINYKFTDSKKFFYYDNYHFNESDSKLFEYESTINILGNNVSSSGTISVAKGIGLCTLKLPYTLGPITTDYEINFLESK